MSLNLSYTNETNKPIIAKHPFLVGLVLSVGGLSLHTYNIGSVFWCMGGERCG